MKRIAAIFVPALIAFGLAVFGPLTITGCKTQAPPPAWALTAPERTVGDVIATANAAVVKYKADVKAGVPSAANLQLKAVMQKIQKSLAVAQPGYNAWSKALKANPNAPQPAELAGAIASLQALLGQLPSLTN